MIVSDSEEETDQNLAKTKGNSKASNDDTKRYLNVVDVCSTRELFFTFREDLKEQIGC